jgi:IclR family transcriptional regulator, KDG regulon repressor
MEKKSPYSVQSVERTLLILETIAHCEDGIRIRELVQRIDLNISTAHRLVNLLEQHGYLEQDMETKKYFLGLKVMELQGLYIQRTRIPEIGAIVLRKLVQEIGATAHLAVLQEGNVVYIDSYEGKDSSISRAAIGRRMPIHCTALGKVLVAWQPWEQIEPYLIRHGIETRTPYTIQSIPEYKAHLNTVRDQGYALDRMENSLSSCCISAPIRDHRNDVVAAISISCPSYLNAEIENERFRAPLFAAVQEIGIKIGNRMERRS